MLASERNKTGAALNSLILQQKNSENSETVFLPLTPKG